MMNIYIYDGPNMDLIGNRPALYYGLIPYLKMKDMTLELIKNLEFTSSIKSIVWQQTSEEHLFINWLSNIPSHQDSHLIINPASWSHTSLAICDTLEVLREREVYICEVHLSQLYERTFKAQGDSVESMRLKRLTAKYANSIIEGFGSSVYLSAISSLVMKKRFQLESKNA
jgi:3-dehydroquinate dehydratase